MRLCARAGMAWHQEKFMTIQVAERQTATDSSDACIVAVLYEDVSARDRAIQVCDGLAQEFMKDLQFEITWWKFKYLSDPSIAQDAAQAASKADLILVSAHNVEAMPAEVK